MRSVGCERSEQGVGSRKEKCGLLKASTTPVPEGMNDEWGVRWLGRSEINI